MEEEAEQMQFVLRRVNLAATLLAGPFDTDQSSAHCIITYAPGASASGG